MPELRKDPVIGRWVIIARERAVRPNEFYQPKPVPRGPEGCPFCEGNEGVTPPEILALRHSGTANGPGWRIRVVPNKFPALRVEGDLDKRGEGIYDFMNGIGAHEVIIESPRHILTLTDLEEVQIREVLWVYKERLSDLKKDARLVYGLVFKNVGERAGASLEHGHSQIIVTPIVPMRVQNEIDRCRTYYEFRGRCLFCDMIQQEMAGAVRIIASTSNFVAFAPFASRFPFETHVLPKKHVSHFEMTEEGFLGELAGLLKNTLTRIERAVSSPPYNYLIHTSPLNSGPLEHYHWHFEIIPRITRTAGFEWGTGFYINPVPPEDAARYLSELKI